MPLVPKPMGAPPPADAIFSPFFLAVAPIATDDPKIVSTSFEVRLLYRSIWETTLSNRVLNSIISRSSPSTFTSLPRATIFSFGNCFLNTSKCRSEEHTSELQSLMRISYAVFCLKKNKLLNYTYQTDHLIHDSTQPNKQQAITTK